MELIVGEEADKIKQVSQAEAKRKRRKKKKEKIVKKKKEVVEREQRVSASHSFDNYDLIGFTGEGSKGKGREREEGTRTIVTRAEKEAERSAEDGLIARRRSHGPR